MSSLKNSSLRKAAADLSQVLNSSLGNNQDCMQAIAEIETVINSIEQKLNTPFSADADDTASGEVLSFAPEKVVSSI